MPGIGGTDRKPGWADSRLCLGAKPPHARGQLEQWLAAGNNKGPTQQETRQPLLLNLSSSFDLAGKGFRSYLAVAEQPGTTKRRENSKDGHRKLT